MKSRTCCANDLDDLQIIPSDLFKKGGLFILIKTAFVKKRKK